MITGRQRVNSVLRHKEIDTVPKYDSFWNSTIKRWYKEGLRKDKPASDIFEYDMEIIYADTSPQYPRLIIEENEEYIVERLMWGEVVKNHKDYSTTPQLISYPIKNKKDWDYLKEKLVVNESRLDNINTLFNLNASIPNKSWTSNLEEYRSKHKKGIFLCFMAHIGVGLVQHYLGSPRYLEMMATEPKLLMDMFLTQAKFVIEVFEFFAEKGLNFFDAVFFANDMGYRNNLLFSPTMYKEQIFPADKQICNYFHGIGLPVILHSDGDIRKLIPFLIEAGFDCIQPLEVKAGMNVIELKKQYGDHLSFMGGIDVRAMADSDTNKIEQEIKNKFEIAKKGGGYIYCSDHSIPENVSFSQYNRVIELVDKYGKY
ncbi:MAG: hypothetical protein FJW69_07165 [Actinobacteria bacterium]|nr:hypothetical protein [Actinomycetota bacterium]